MNQIIGSILGNYRILKKIGEGGMGSVFLARDLSLEREVAIKIISPELARSQELMARFRVEAIAQAKLNHGHIVTIHSFDQDKNAYYIVMEYVEGQNLKESIKEKGPMPIVQGLKIFLQILSGIGYAHANGVMHRDIKPSNLFLSKNQTAKICDFGIAKVKGIEGLTKVGTALGSPVYSSPEQLLGKKTDIRTDIYSLGITLYEMLTGVLPFTITGKSSYDVIKQTLDAVPRQPSQVNPAISAPVEALILKSIAKDPAERFQNIAEFEAAIQETIFSLTPVPGKSPTPAPGPKPTAKKFTPTFKFNRLPSKQHRIAILAMAGVLIVLLLFLLFYTRSTPVIKTAHTTANNPSPSISSHSPTAQIPNTLQPAPQTPTPSSPPPTPGGNTPSNTPVQEPAKTTPATQLSVPGTAADILRRMERLITNEEYKKAVAAGRYAVKNGVQSGEILLAIGKAYFYDGEKKNARSYYFKALEADPSIHFSIQYQNQGAQIFNGILRITHGTLSFAPFKESTNKNSFSIPMSQIKQVSQDVTADFVRIFKKKKNRKNPALIIKTRGGPKYTLLMTSNNKTLRSFIEDIIDTLRERSK